VKLKKVPNLSAEKIYRERLICVEIHLQRPRSQPKRSATLPEEPEKVR